MARCSVNAENCCLVHPPGCLPTPIPPSRLPSCRRRQSSHSSRARSLPQRLHGGVARTHKSALAVRRSDNRSGPPTNPDPANAAHLSRNSVPNTPGSKVGLPTAFPPCWQSSAVPRNPTCDVIPQQPPHGGRHPGDGLVGGGLGRGVPAEDAGHPRRRHRVPQPVGCDDQPGARGRQLELQAVRAQRDDI